MLFLSYSLQQIISQFFIIQHVWWIKISRFLFGLGSSWVIFYFNFIHFLRFQPYLTLPHSLFSTFPLDFDFHLVALVDKFLKKKLKKRRDSNPGRLDAPLHSQSFITHNVFHYFSKLNNLKNYLSFYSIHWQLKKKWNFWSCAKEH